jgi:integrase
MRQVKEFDTADGKRFRVRYRSAGAETSETFRRKSDAETFRDILGNGRNDRVAEALAWLAAKESDRETETFGAWFESYIDQLTGVTPRTRDDYKAMHRRYLTHLDPLPLPLLTRAHVASTVNKLEAEGKSPKTIKNVIHMLSSVLALAVDDGHLTRNPTRRVRLPKAQLNEDEAERFLTHEEAGRLVAATQEHYRPLVAFLLGTGLRWSEATALQARHINLEAGTVRVQRAWKRVPGGWEIGPPKSPKANRTVNAGVPALVAVVPLLGKPTDFVFTTPTGRVVRHSNFYNRVWQPACVAAGLGDWEPSGDGRTWNGPSPHDCRHTHASWLLSSGEIHGIEAVQDQLGHESSETTRKVYAKLMPAVGVAVGKSASAAMARVLASAQRAEAHAIAVGTMSLEAVSHTDQP